MASAPTGPLPWFDDSDPPLPAPGAGFPPGAVDPDEPPPPGEFELTGMPKRLAPSPPELAAMPPAIAANAAASALPPLSLLEPDMARTDWPLIWAGAEPGVRVAMPPPMTTALGLPGTRATSNDLPPMSIDDG